MQDGLNLPFICEATPDYFIEWFAWFQEIINDSHLEDEEKFLGLWLANQCANNISLSCLYNYEQISQAVNKSLRKIHCILMRLRLTGFILAEIEIHYGEPTPEMVQTTYTIKLTLPFKPRLVNEEVIKEIVNKVGSEYQPVTVNLLGSTEFQLKSENKSHFLSRFFKRKNKKDDDKKEHPNE